MQRQCQMMFPKAFPRTPSIQDVQVERTNNRYGGWDVHVDRLFFANGERKCLLKNATSCLLCIRLAGDPWKDATVSAEGRIPISTPLRPVALSDGFHASDLSTNVGLVDPSVAVVQSAALDSMRRWLLEWTPSSDIPGHTSQTFDDASNGFQGHPYHIHPFKAVNAFFRSPGAFT